MKTTLIVLMALFALLLVFTACDKTLDSHPDDRFNSDDEINSFEDCVAAGNPVMESYPRQCAANGKTFVEDVAPIDDVLLPGFEDETPVLASPEFNECSQEQKDAQFCTLEYMPVCGLVDNGVRCITEPCPNLEAKTFGNDCSACSAGAIGTYDGACEELSFVVCNGESGKNGFDPVKFANDTGGVCVETCPTNYDAYMTQIAIELCIPHYGEEEINSWEECSASSETCNCVRTYETTDNVQIEDAGYRCVPEDYAGRLIFRGGLDRLDENGEQSVMIA